MVRWRGASRMNRRARRADAAVLVPFQRVLPLGSRTRITSCGLGSGGRQRLRHTYVRHDRTAGEQCRQVPPLGFAWGSRGQQLCSSMGSRSAWLNGCGGDGRAGGPSGDGRRSGGCGNSSSGRWSCCSGGSSGGGGSFGVGGRCGGQGGGR